MTNKYYREYGIQQQLPLKYENSNNLKMYTEPTQLKFDFNQKEVETKEPSQLELKFK